MTTLYSYLNTLSGIASRVFFDVAPTRSGLPYAVLYEGIEGVAQPLYLNSDIVALIVSVQVFYPPPVSSTLESARVKFGVLMDLVSRAVHYVDTGSDGVTPLIALHRVSTPGSGYDPDNKGYSGTVRFSAQFLRR